MWDCVFRSRANLNIIAGLLWLSIVPSCGLLVPKRDWPKTNFDIQTVALNEFILFDALPRDFVPAMDKPEFISNDKAAIWIEGKESVGGGVHFAFAWLAFIQMLLFIEQMLKF